MLCQTRPVVPRALLLAALALAATATLAHGPDPRYQQLLDWKAPGITRTLALGHSLGLQFKGETRVETIDGRRCIVGGLVGFDVDDDYAFDLDETVELELELGPRTSDRFLVVYDRNGTVDSHLLETVDAAPGSRWYRTVVPLPRARFAGRGTLGTDLAIGGYPWGATLTLCHLAVRRTQPAPPAAAPAGTLQLTLTDAATGQPTAARVGLYDASGRLPLPGAEAVPVRYFADQVRMVAARTGTRWPAANGWVFYVDGRYSAQLPAGRYELVVSKGPEYRIARRSLTVAGEKTLTLTVALERWADLPARGWYSGDVHIHLGRRESDNPAILAQIAAEDLHVANLLQMGNIRTTAFEQYAWGPEGQFRRGDRVLVPGQEDPRTGHRGHTISLNLRQPVRDPGRYFLYHEVFDAVDRQGGLSGYAHLAARWFEVERGLALDVPFGIVDFVEVLQIGVCTTDLWYQFLNLGYKLVPAAGSDFPYCDLPGTVRSYVRIDGPFSPRAWFDGLAAGRTFVTNGPMLELRVNGQEMGGELRVGPGTPLIVKATASMNPDVDLLARLELIVHGEVVKTAESAAGAETLRLSHRLTADHGLWLAVRARGHYKDEDEWDTVVAHSAPVYVSVDGGRFWKTAEVPALIDAQRAELEELLSAPLVPRDDLEFWITAEPLAAEWRRQKPLLARRVAAANARYDALLAALRPQAKAP